VWALTIKDIVFSVTAGLISEILLCCYLLITLYNGLKISEHETNWLMNFMLLLVGHMKKFSDIINHSLFKVVCTIKSKQASTKKISNFTVNRDHIKKKN